MPSTAVNAADRPDTSDAGQDLLLDAVVLVAAVQPIGDAAHVVLVFGNVGIQQQQRDSAHLRDPHPGPQPVLVGQCQFHQDRLVRRGGEQPQGQALRVQRRIGFMLPTVGGQRLAEVPGPVVEADRDQRHTQIRGGFEVIAGQDAQATRVVGQHLRHPELHREVRDSRRQCCARGGLLLIPQRPRQVLAKIVGQPIQPFEERLVDGKLVQALRGHRAQQRNRILADALPQCGIDRSEQLLGRPVPRPSQVHRQLLQCSQAVGQMSTDGETTQCLHAALPY